MHLRGHFYRTQQHMILLSLHLSLLGDQTASSILHGISAWSAVQGIILGSTMFAGLGGVGKKRAGCGDLPRGQQQEEH